MSKKVGCFSDPQTDIDKFCCDPSSLVVDEGTANYYRRLCDARQESHDYWQVQLDKFGESMVNFPENFILGIFSPEGLELLGLTLGIDLSGTVALNAMLRVIAVGAGKNVMAAAGELASTEGALWVNNAILTAVLSSAVKEGTMAALAYRLTRLLSTAVSRIANVLAIVQLLGMILDSWDPMGYGQELNAEAMEALGNEFDRAFQAAFMNQVPIGQDELGKPIFPTEWPIEYTVPPPQEKETALKDQSANMWPYIVEYLNALKYNSDGYPIDRPKGGNLIAPNWGKVADTVFLQWTSGNTVAAEYLHETGRRVIGWIGVVLFALYLFASLSPNSSSSTWRAKF